MCGRSGSFLTHGSPARLPQVGFSASLGLVQRSGADVETFMRILRASALYAPTYDKKLGKMLTEDFGTANFPTKVRPGTRRSFTERSKHASHRLCACRLDLGTGS